MRVETGPMQFGDDWSGVFIRGDNAFFFLKVCEAITASNPVSKRGLEELKQLLASAQIRPDMDVTKLKPFDDCVEEQCVKQRRNV